MRPRRKILLWGYREEQASQLAFMLNIQPWCVVTTATTDAQFEALLHAHQWEAVIVPHAIGPVRTANKVRIAKRAADYPVLILTWEKGYDAPMDTGADLVLPFGASNAELIERLRVISTRKRGPKPGSHRKPVASVEASIEEAVHAS